MQFSLDFTQYTFFRFFVFVFLRFPLYKYTRKDLCHVNTLSSSALCSFLLFSLNFTHYNIFFSRRFYFCIVVVVFLRFPLLHFHKHPQSIHITPLSLLILPTRLLFSSNLTHNISSPRFPVFLPSRFHKYPEKHHSTSLLSPGQLRTLSYYFLWILYINNIPRFSILFFYASRFYKNRQKVK